MVHTGWCIVCTCSSIQIIERVHKSILCKQVDSLVFFFPPLVFWTRIIYIYNVSYTHCNNIYTIYSRNSYLYSLGTHNIIYDDVRVIIVTFAATANCVYLICLFECVFCFLWDFRRRSQLHAPATGEWGWVCVCLRGQSARNVTI